MKKTIQIAGALIMSSWMITATAYAAKPSLECKAQLARASESLTEILPKGSSYANLELSDTGGAKTSLTFSLNETADTAYRLDLNAQTKASNWRRGVLAFKLEVKVWNLKTGKLVASSSLDSDNVRTQYLLSQLLEEDKAMIASDVASFEMRKNLLSSGDEQVLKFAGRGEWIAATQTALSKALVHPEAADFVSIHCTLEN